jgi:hypothetical protein
METKVDVYQRLLSKLCFWNAPPSQAKAQVRAWEKAVGVVAELAWEEAEAVAVVWERSEVANSKLARAPVAALAVAADAGEQVEALAALAVAQRARKVLRGDFLTRP